MSLGWDWGLSLLLDWSLSLFVACEMLALNSLRYGRFSPRFGLASSCD